MVCVRRQRDLARPGARPLSDRTRVKSVTPHEWDLWHDRAVLHFLTDSQDRTAYRLTLLESVAPGGHVIIATFGPDGPTRCSGLDVRRYSAESLHETLGSDLELIESRKEAHQTPRGVVQQFLYCRFRLVDAS